MDASTASTVTHKSKGHSRQIIAMIGVLKLLKGALMVMVALLALWLTRQSSGQHVHDWALNWADELNVGPHRHRIGLWIANSVLKLNARRLVGVAIGALLYSAIFITEGVGLLLDKLWAEWMAVISTAGFIPIEIMELYNKHTLPRAITVVLNMAIAAYLVVRVRTRMRQAKEE